MRKILVLIEEYVPEEDALTEDPDIAAKLYDVTNQVMYELCRMKKIARYVEMPAVKGQVITLPEISAVCGNTVYQIDVVRGVPYEYRAGGTVLKILESGTAEIDCFVYPKRIYADTPDDYELELSDDALEILPYGVAADLLKNDKSMEYGTVYGTTYERMLSRLDSRVHMASIYIDGGVSI